MVGFLLLLLFGAGIFGWIGLMQKLQDEGVDVANNIWLVLIAAIILGTIFFIIS